MSTHIDDLVAVLNRAELHGWTVTNHINRIELTHAQKPNESWFLFWSTKDDQWKAVFRPYDWNPGVLD